MTYSNVRVRFAPAPTGIMHIGNIRTALLNYLFARQKNGVMVLRIEDTDAQRNFDPTASIIISDLTWLAISYDEGPIKGGPDEPYFQSQRTAIYQTHLQKLIDTENVYRCFCSEERLELQRQRQQALGLPPRYDGTCLRLSSTQIDEFLHQSYPFIWRFKIDHDRTVSITDLARGTVTFEMKHFSDFPLTRTDGSFTFLFANFVDDMLMRITHVFRGEDHLTNTACQALLYDAFHAPLPTFWHMPIICNIDGKKLSKRDFGFSLHDLQEGGFLPEAITNYLAIIGGSFAQEIQSMADLIKTFNFNQLSSSSQIKYDVDKLRWVNHEWIQQLPAAELTNRARPFLEHEFSTAKSISDDALTKLIQVIKPEVYTLTEFPAALRFYFEKPSLAATDIAACIPVEHRKAIYGMVKKVLPQLQNPDMAIKELKKAAQTSNIPLKEIFWFVRLALIGSINGPGVVELIAMLGPDKSCERLEYASELLSE